MPEDSPILGGQRFAPHPFVLEPPRTGKLEYAPGDTLACNLVLIGEAINLLPWMVFTLNEIGKRRIGVQGKSGQCLLDKVESLPIGKNQQCQTVYTAETQMLAEDSLILRPDDMIRSTPDVARRIELEFLTPTSIKVAGRWMSDLRFEHLIRDLLCRIRSLSYFHCSENLDVDDTSLFRAANLVTHESHLRWFRADRRLYRGEPSMPIGGSSAGSV